MNTDACRLHIARDDASNVVPDVASCGLNVSGLPSEQYTSVDADTGPLLKATENNIDTSNPDFTLSPLFIPSRLFEELSMVLFSS